MKRFISVGIGLIGLMVFLACGGGHTADDGQTPTNGEESHEEESESTQTVLNAEQIKSIGVLLGEIENKKLTTSIVAVGSLEVPNFNRASATSLYGGVVQRLFVQVGTSVKKGQVIATIADPKFVQLQEEYLTLDSRITFAGQELTRQTELNQGNAGALKNLQNAKAELEALQTRRASLQQQLKLMGINPASLTIQNLQSSLPVKSPVGGTVSDVFAKVGSYVDVSSPVAEIVDNDAVHLDLYIFEKDLPSIRVGQAVNFSLTNNPGRLYEAAVFSIGASFQGEGKSVVVHCTIKGDKTGLIDGMGINGTISLDNVTAEAVPNEAIVEAEGKYYILVVAGRGGEEEHAHEGEESEDGHSHEAEAGSLNFEKIEVAKGESSMGYTAITPVKELPAGTKIAVKGAFFIHAKMSNTGGHHH